MPVLGICYGMQLMTDVLGGKCAARVSASSVTRTCASQATARRRRSFRAGAGRAARLGEPWRRRRRRAAWLRRRGDERDGADRGDGGAGSRLYALLFHPEVAHTDHGLAILRNFAYGVCGCIGDWTIASFIEEATERIREQVGDGKVVCGLSGGVDSTVAAMLIHRAIGDRLTCIFVDNGLLRLRRGEPDRQAVHGEAAAAARLRRRDATCSSSGWPASPIRSRNGRSSARRSSTCSRSARTSWAASTSSRRARYIPT